MEQQRPIGIFDSGYGGLTVLKEILEVLPQYDYVYLGDNARVPYGNRSFETVFQYTWQCVRYLLEEGCPLVVVACNTASAKALRNIQQQMLPIYFPDRKVLGVIRPTTELVGNLSTSKEVGIFATQGTVTSRTYPIEIKKFYPNVKTYQQACPMWVPIIENNEHLSPGADYFVKKYIDELLQQSAEIDTIILGCTHYPLLIDVLKKYLPENIKVVSQGEIVAGSLKDYLQRHDEIESTLSKNQHRAYFTTDDPLIFAQKSKLFLEKEITAEHISLI